MLDPAIAELNQRLRDAGLDDVFLDGTDGKLARARGIRARDTFYPSPVLPEGEVSLISIPSSTGNVPARIVKPYDGLATATVIYFHGGGWMIGDLDTHHYHAVKIANAASAVVVNVDYRLAPEHCFPAAVDDAFAALSWARNHVDTLGGDSTKLAIAGDSAGGNLAASAALWARDNNISLAAQFLAYPLTDLSRGPDASYVEAYLAPDVQKNREDLRVSPALAGSLKGVAPVILGVGQLDFLYEDNLAYAAKLLRDGVECVFREYPGLNHGFMSLTGLSEAANLATNEMCAALWGKLHGPRG